MFSFRCVCLLLTYYAERWVWFVDNAQRTIINLGNFGQVIQLPFNISIPCFRFSNQPTKLYYYRYYYFPCWLDSLLKFNARPFPRSIPDWINVTLCQIIKYVQHDSNLSCSANCQRTIQLLDFHQEGRNTSTTLIR